MTNLKLSSKMHILILVSAVIVALGIAMGVVFQFVSDGYFNQGGDYSSYNCVIVDYAYIDGQQDSIKDICDDAFSAAGVKYYACVGGETIEGGQLIYKFTKNVNTDDIKKAKDTISSKIASDDSFSLSSASYHEVESLYGSSKVLKFGAIAVSAAVVFQFIYFAIRYRCNAAFSALLANVHNLAIFVSLLSLTRIPVGSSVYAFGILTVLITMIGCCFMFDKLRKNVKDENFAKLSSFEQVDTTAKESLVSICVTAAAVAVAAVVLFALLSISALSVNVILTTAITALISAAASVYGTAFFMPSVHSRIKQLGDNFILSHSDKAKKS